MLAFSAASCAKKKAEKAAEAAAKEKKEQIRQLRRYQSGREPIADTLQVIQMYHNAVADGYPEFLSALGDIHYRCGHIDSALIYYHQAVKHDENAMLSLADMYVDLALRIQLDTLSPDHALLERYYYQSARYYRAYILHLQGELDEAQEYIDELEAEMEDIEADPADYYYRRP